VTTGRFRKAVARRSASSLDSGFTLIELLVAALLTSILLAIIIAPLTSVTNTANTTESISQAAAVTTAAVKDMQAGISSASEICLPTQVTPSPNPPGRTATAGYAVRVLTKAFSSSGTTRWEQWWVNPSTGQLDAQTWPVASAPPATWRMATANVAATTGGPLPFTITTPASSTTPVVLTVTLTATAGVKATAVSTPVTTSIAALNTAYFTGPGTCLSEVH
jgi:prepilin-type N-terminal cleavage/methylation domain-containing protein